MKKLNFLIVDNQPLFIESLERIIRSQFKCSNICIKNSVSTALSTIQRCESGCCNLDMIILDPSLNDSDGFDLMKRLSSREFDGKVLFISSKPYQPYSKVALYLGANGFITKSENKESIVNAITNVIAGYKMFKHSNTDLESIELSSRELTVLGLLKKGYTNKKISNILSISDKTVSTYKSRILKKYNSKSILDVIFTESMSKTA